MERTQLKEMPLNTYSGPADGLIECDPVADDVWRHLTGPASKSIFNSPEWIKVVTETYGFQPQAVVMWSDGEPVGGIAWADLYDFQHHRRVSLPFSDYGGPVADSQEVAGRLVDHALQGLADGSVDSVTVRGFPEQFSQKFTARANVSVSSWMGVDVSGTEAEVMDRATPAARKGVRKAKRRGVTVTLAANKDDLRDWFNLHLRLRKYKHGLLAQPFSFFEQIWDTFIAPGNGFLLLAKVEGETVAGMFCLQKGDVVYTKFSASDERAHSYKPNNLLYAETILESMRRGARLIDMGRNPRSAPGLIYFKKSFGAYERDLWTATVSDPVVANGNGTSDNGFVHELTRLLVRDDVPDEVTEEAGRLLYRYFA